MVAPRAVWKGFLKLGPVSCGIKLVNVVSEADNIHFRILNRRDSKPVKAAYVDEATGKVVDADDQVKGYEVDGAFLEIEPDEIKKLKLTSEHTLEVDAFVDIDDIDQRYLDKPYFVVPADSAAVETYAVIREALRRKKAAARSCIVLYQRGREVILKPDGEGMLMTTLRPHNQLISEKGVFGGINDVKVDDEMREIAGLLIDKKKTTFDPAKFTDRYQDALLEMIKAKKAGKPLPKPAAPPKENVVNLADVLRKSLKQEGIAAASKGKAKSVPRRKSA